MKLDKYNASYQPKRNTSQWESVKEFRSPFRDPDAKKQASIKATLRELDAVHERRQALRHLDKVYNENPDIYRGTYRAAAETVRPYARKIHRVGRRLRKANTLLERNMADGLEEEARILMPIFKIEEQDFTIEIQEGDIEQGISINREVIQHNYPKEYDGKDKIIIQYHRTSEPEALMSILAHEMWHLRQFNEIRQNPNSEDSQRYTTNYDDWNYVHPDLDYSRYRTQLTEAEANLIGRAVQSEIV